MDATALPTIAAACGGVLLGGGTADITAISKDTRTLRSGDLYWALVGENFDGSPVQPCIGFILSGWDCWHTLKQFRYTHH